MPGPVDPERVRTCTRYAGEAIGTLVKIMQRDDVSPNTRMKAAKEVLQRAFRVLSGMEAREVSNNLFQTAHEFQTRRAQRRQHFARSREQRSARRRKRTATG